MIFGDKALGVGLSPRVRGNLADGAKPEVDTGSIPACTGKPGFDMPIWQAAQVYPRVYGETGLGRKRYLSLPGLSPRVRGNRVGEFKRNCHFGSIPACTGKPTTRREIATWRRVYPRVYGETDT